MVIIDQIFNYLSYFQELALTTLKLAKSDMEQDDLSRQIKELQHQRSLTLSQCDKLKMYGLFY